jgi:hypothetical protein
LSSISIIAVSLVITVECYPVHECSKINCYIRHLKTADKLNANFTEFEIESEALDCDEVIESVKTQIYDAFVPSMLGEDFVSLKECFVSEMKTRNWADEALLQVILDASLSMSEVEKHQKMKESKRNAIKTSLVSMKSCGFNRKSYEELFETRLRIFNESANDPIADVCAKKYVIDNQLLDTEIYNIDVNSTDSDVDCKIFLDKTSETFKQGIIDELKSSATVNQHLANEQLQCLTEKLTQYNVVGAMFKVHVLSKLHITVEQKEEEKKQFAEQMDQISIADCF